MSKETKKVKIDYGRLCQALSDARKSKAQFSRELGRSDTFISQLKNNHMQPEGLENLMCALLGLTPGALVAKEKPKEAVANHGIDGAEIKKMGYILLDVKTTMMGLVGDRAEQKKANENVLKKMASLEETLNAVYSKVNANTVQIEKIKESTQKQSESESERAEKYLTEKLASGESDAKEIFDGADEFCIKRAEIMKAKNRLGIQVFQRGYGKNQKAVWVLE